MKKNLILTLFSILTFSCMGGASQQSRINTNGIGDDSEATFAQECIKCKDSIDCNLLNMKFTSLQELNDFGVENQRDYFIYSKRLALLLNCPDSVFMDNDGALIYSGCKNNICVNIGYTNLSSAENDSMRFLLIHKNVSTDKQDVSREITGFIRVNHGSTYSAQCRLSDSSNYIAGICIGKYPIIEGDNAILFEINEIYGVDFDGKLTKLPLDTRIDYCTEPFEPEFVGDRIPTYYFYTKKTTRRSQQWQQ